MKKVLIATTNKDKYNAVSRIFKRTIFPEKEYHILSLYDISTKINDEKEHGNNIERAKAKAINAYKQLKNQSLDFIVGLDDAIRIKNKIEPNIKEYINKILFENYLSDSEEYSFNRAYCICDKNGNLYETTADIPYIYHPLEKDYIPEEHTYPLSKVAYPIGSKKAICDLSEEEEINYYLKYVKDKLLSINIH